ncbi:MAG: hypothetical protein LBS10_05300 [Gracilibacteraceae bacterium]|jgi:hypothetical protein|nr:hypothetical protein [Gracilibacteraceae bacterium]
MEEKLRRLKEYLNMETELPFADFEAFWREVLGDLQQNYEGMSRADRLRAAYICEIVGGNAGARARKEKGHAKSFRKMADKGRFWQEAIKHRLHKEGASDAEIEAETAELLERA